MEKTNGKANAHAAGTNGANGHASEVRFGKLKKKGLRFDIDLATKRAIVAQIQAGANKRELANDLGCNVATLDYWTDQITKETTSGDASSAVKRASLALADTAIRDAVVYLRHAQAAISRKYQSGKIRELEEEHLLTMLALRTLQGGI